MAKKVTILTCEACYWFVRVNSKPLCRFPAGIESKYKPLRDLKKCERFWDNR